jgi:hypothetical protein
MRIKLGSVAYLRAANTGYGIGLDDEGHRVEFLGDRHALAVAPLGEYLEVEDWQVLAVDEELRLPLTRLAMAQRTAFIRATLAEDSKLQYDRSLIHCRALGCTRRRVRPGASHCKVHSVEWYAIEADQRELKERGSPITAREWKDLRARRLAMNMSWPPRNLAGRGPSE